MIFPRGKARTLVIPQSLYDELERVAKERNLTVLDVLKRCIWLGLLIDAADSVYLSKGGGDQ